MTYYKTYGIIAFKKHVNANHDIIEKKFEEKFNSPMRKRMERQLVKKRLNVYGSAISNFFGVKDLLKKDDV
jgi:hypothetical protein